MKRSSKRKENVRVIRLWTHPEAVRALPYFRSITSSLRDHWLDLQCHTRTLNRLGDVKRPNRQTFLAQEMTKKEKDLAENNFQNSLEEMNKLDVFLLDPLEGSALIPFKKEEDLAWFVFDLFDENGLKTWRYHHDPMETRRPWEVSTGETTGLPAPTV